MRQLLGYVVCAEKNNSMTSSDDCVVAIRVDSEIHALKYRALHLSRRQEACQRCCKRMLGNRRAAVASSEQFAGIGVGVGKESW